MIAAAEPTPALAALQADPSAVVAYDKVPASSASGVFTLDTSAEMFVLHSGQAVPAGGGLLVATGKMWIAPQVHGALPHAPQVLSEDWNFTTWVLPTPGCLSAWGELRHDLSCCRGEA